jgi:hypothetical protein
MDCVKPEELLDVLYEDPDTPARARVRAHLDACAACRGELAALEGVRRALGSWRLKDAPSLLPRRAVPRATWWLAAAATLLLALGAGLGLSGSELRFEDGRFAFRLGRASDADVAALLAAQEARHRQEISQLRAELTGSQNGAVLENVRKLIRQSEERNALLVGASLAELSERYEAQRRYDLARVSASLSYLDGRTGQQLARTSELMGVMLRAADEQ